MIAQSIMPKAAATPAARTPEPYSRPMAIMVAAAAFEEVVGAALLDAVFAAVAEALTLELVVTGAVKLAGLSLPQFSSSLSVQSI